MADLLRQANKEIPLDVAKHMIVTALRDFDPQLGSRAESVLYNSDRLNIVEAAVQSAGMMQCRPAGLTIEDLKSSDMYLEDYAERFGPHFVQQDNKGDYAVIDYEYTGTENSIIYLGHEVGHAIADDIQREHGRSFRNFSGNQLEEQAYFIQSIVANAVLPEFNRDSASYAESSAARIGKEFNRQSQRYDAYTAFEKAATLSEEQRTHYILDVLGGQLPSEKKERAVSLASAARFER